MKILEAHTQFSFIFLEFLTAKIIANKRFLHYSESSASYIAPLSKEHFNKHFGQPVSK